MREFTLKTNVGHRVVRGCMLDAQVKSRTLSVFQGAFVELAMCFSDCWLLPENVFQKLFRKR